MSLTVAAASDGREHAHTRNRGTILLASTNSAWLSVVGAMVVDSGFVPAYPAEGETPWLSMARTHPCIAICDCDVPVERIQRLVLEAWARHVPVLVSATGRSTKARSLQPRRVARFRLPVSPDAFSSMLDRLLPWANASRVPRADGRGGSKHTAGVRPHILPTVRRDRSGPGRRESAHNGDSDASDNARADDDGMACRCPPDPPSGADAHHVHRV
jgi:hypothetical protein